MILGTLLQDSVPIWRNSLTSQKVRQMRRLRPLSAPEVFTLNTNSQLVHSSKTLSFSYHLLLDTLHRKNQFYGALLLCKALMVPFSRIGDARQIAIVHEVSKLHAPTYRVQGRSPHEILIILAWSFGNSIDRIDNRF